MPQIDRTTIGSIGIAMLGWAVMAVSIERDVDVFALGILVVVIGLGWHCTHQVMVRITQHNRPADDAWRDGYELGYDKGWSEGNAGQSNNNLIMMHERRRNAVDRKTS